MKDKHIVISVQRGSVICVSCDFADENEIDSFTVEYDEEGNIITYERTIVVDAVEQCRIQQELAAFDERGGGTL
jgi:hypothetical protein